MITVLSGETHERFPETLRRYMDETDYAPQPKTDLGVLRRQLAAIMQYLKGHGFKN